MVVRRKRSISLPPDLDVEIAAAAQAEGVTYSAWLAESARRRIVVERGLAAVAEFERLHGAFTDAERADADRWVAQLDERSRRTGTTRRSA